MEESELQKLEVELKNKEKEIVLRRKEKEINSRFNQLEQSEKPSFDFNKYKGLIIGSVVGIALLLIAIRIIMRFI